MLSKDEILAIYLNESPYGGTLYGVEEVVKLSLIKQQDVTLAEAFYIVDYHNHHHGILHMNNRDLLDARKNQVLERMYVNEMISHDEYITAREEAVEFIPSSLTGIKAPHFVMYVRDLLRISMGRML